MRGGTNGRVDRHANIAFCEKGVVAIDDDEDPAWNEWRRKRGTNTDEVNEESRHLGWPAMEREDAAGTCVEEADKLYDADLSANYCSLLSELGPILGLGGITVVEGGQRKVKTGKEASGGNRAPEATTPATDSATVPLGIPGVCALSGHPVSSAAGENGTGSSIPEPEKPPPEPPPKKKMIVITTPAKVYRAKPASMFRDPDIGGDMLDKNWVEKDFGRSLAVKKLELPPRDDTTLFTRENSEELLRNIRLDGCPEMLKEAIVRVVEEYWDVFAEGGLRKPIRGFSF